MPLDARNSRLNFFIFFLEQGMDCSFPWGVQKTYNDFTPPNHRLFFPSPERSAVILFFVCKVQFAAILVADFAATKKSP